MTRLEWRSYEVGHCVHPACSVRTGDGVQLRRFPALAFLIVHPAKGRVLFDTGYSPHFFEATRHLPERLYRVATPPRLQADQSLIRQLARDGIGSADIATVVLSHLHGDHVGGLHDFPDSRIVCSREGWQDLRDRGRMSAALHGLLPGLLPEDLPARAQWIEDLPRVSLPGAFAEFGAGHDILGDASLLAVALPGHAAGHYGVLFRDADDAPVFLVADAAWSTRALEDGIPPPRLVTDWLGDTAAYRATLARLKRLRQVCPEMRMIPSHCGEGTNR